MPVMDYGGIVTAAQGTFDLNDNTETVLNTALIYVAEDTVFSRIEVDGDTGTDVKADYVKVAATAVKAGVMLTPRLSKNHLRFSAVTLVSGSVVLIEG